MAGGAGAGATKMTSLDDAIANVAVLENLDLFNDQPCIEACPVSLDCDQDMDTNFTDR